MLSPERAKLPVTSDFKLEFHVKFSPDGSHLITNSGPFRVGRVAEEYKVIEGGAI
jgi:hypothetical protein